MKGGSRSRGRIVKGEGERECIGRGREGKWERMVEEEYS